MEMENEQKVVFKSELIQRVKKKFKLTTTESDEIVSFIFDTIKKEMFDGNVVIVRGFGKFYGKRKMERIGVNPRNGEHMIISGRVTPKYEPATTFRKELKKKTEKKHSE